LTSRLSRAEKRQVEVANQIRARCACIKWEKSRQAEPQGSLDKTPVIHKKKDPHAETYYSRKKNDQKKTFLGRRFVQHRSGGGGPKEPKQNQSMEVGNVRKKRGTTKESGVKLLMNERHEGKAPHKIQKVLF